jgi:translocation and assembly module TamB
VKQWLKYILINPLAALLLVGIAVLLIIALLIFSSTGTRLLANNSRYFVSGLTLEGAEGALVSGLTLKHLQWKDDATQVDASQISLKNTLDIGVASTLIVKSLHADKLVIRLLASADGKKDSTPFKPPTLFLPFNIDARSIDIGELEIWRGDTPLRLHNVKLVGHTLDGRLQVDSLRLDGVMGELAVNGVVGWQDAITWQANVTGKHINPVAYLKDMPADLNVALTSSGTWAQGKTQVSLDISKLQGRLREYPVDVKGQAEWGGKLLTLRKVNALIGDNQVQAEGNVGESFDLRWQIDAKNLATAWKGLEGNVKGSGILKGKLDKPEIQADLKGGKLRYQDYRLGAFDLQASQAGESYTVKGKMQDFKIGDTVIPSAILDAQGSLENHRISAQLTHAEGKVDFVANGGLKNMQWRGTVQTLSLRDTAAGAWNMAGAVTLEAGANAFSSSEICLTDRGARVCGKPTWTREKGLSMTGNVQQMPLVMLRQWLPAALNPNGTANATYQFEQRGGKPTGELDLRLSDGTLNVSGGNGKLETLRYTNATAKVNLDDRQISGQAQLDLTGYGQVRADGQLNLSLPDGNHRINAHLRAEMPDIAWLERFSPQIDDLRGRMDGDVQITGSLNDPKITGTARLSNGQVHLPEAGVTLDAISLTMQASGADRAVITGSLRAGQGVLNANGVLSLANLPQWHAEVSLQGNNLKLMDTHEVQAWVSPNLQLQISPASVAISGNVLIPESTISLREIPQTASPRSDDVVIVGRRAPQRQVHAQVSVKEAPLDIQPNVTIELGDKVKFTGFGLDARLNGKLHVSRTRQDILAEGVLNVTQGVYKAYGQNLAIERGRLIFNGPLDNPGLDVRAVREVDGGDIKVGIALAGTVQQPESTLFSTPQQTQSDTLSYLLTGRAMSGLSGDQSSLLVEAVSQLGVVGGEGLVQQLGGSLGLDELGLKTKDGNFAQSELALGKRLGARLYVRYIVSLFDSLQRVAITYQINKRVQLEAKAGVHQGIDLIYKLDTNWGPLGP